MRVQNPYWVTYPVFLAALAPEVRQNIKDHFWTNPVGWGATYHAHPVAMACAYETLKHMLKAGPSLSSKPGLSLKRFEVPPPVQRTTATSVGGEFHVSQTYDSLCFLALSTERHAPPQFWDTTCSFLFETSIGFHCSWIPGS